MSVFLDFWCGIIFYKKGDVIIVNEYEKEQTARFEGTYSQQEIDLNNRLYEECLKECLDVSAIKELLKQGADPLGATAVSGWGLLEHVYGGIIFEMSQRENTDNLPIITELFLESGMDMDKPKVPYDEENSLNPMWNMAYIVDENTLCVLKTLLDNGLSAVSAAEMWDHIIFDLYVEWGVHGNSEYKGCELTGAMKVVMLCASYDHVLNEDEGLQEFIGCSHNNYDIHKFRNWNDFYYVFDEKRPQSNRIGVRIYDVKSKCEVWKFEF